MYSVREKIEVAPEYRNQLIEDFDENFDDADSNDKIDDVLKMNDEQ